MEAILVSGIIGALVTLAGTGAVHLWLEKRREKAENKRLIYEPLLRELEMTFSGILGFDSNCTRDEWDRVCYKDHIAHRINKKLECQLVVFYGQYDELIEAICKANRAIVSHLHNEFKEEQSVRIDGIALSSFCPSLIRGKASGRRNVLESNFRCINRDLVKKYDSCDSFFVDCLKMAEGLEEIKVVRKKQKELLQLLDKLLPKIEKKVTA